MVSKKIYIRTRTEVLVNTNDRVKALNSSLIFVFRNKTLNQEFMAYALINFVKEETLKAISL